LSTSPTVLVQRLSHGERPSLTGKPLKEDVYATLAIRERLYRTIADWVVATDDKRAQEIAQDIMALEKDQ
jgi:shikimate kinase